MNENSPLTVNGINCPEGFSNSHTIINKGWLWECPNMKPVKGDTSMEYEHYECKVCGRSDKLDYEEMR